MKVYFYATLREIAGGRTVEFNAEGLTAQELLEAVVTRFPPMRKELFDADGRMFGHVHLFINGRDVQFLDDKLHTRVTLNDAINIFPAVGGG